MIQLEKVSFTYKSDQDKSDQAMGLSQVSLIIEQGETVLVCGPSGCGKTTLTRLVNGLVPHYYEGQLSGQSWVCGMNVFEQPIHLVSDYIGSVFQNPRSQFFNVDTTSELAFAAENQGLDEDFIRQRVMATVQEFKISELLDRSLFRLSGGEKQKIACASVSVANPEVLVLDEPSSNLDLDSISQLRDVLLYWKSQSKTVLIAEHRLFFLEGLLDRIIYMENGQIKEVYDKQAIAELSEQDLSDKGLRPFHLPKLVADRERQVEKKWLLTDFRFSYKRFFRSVDDAAPILQIDRLALPNNQIIALLGRNGAGKTTFARCLCGLQKEFKGKLTIDGQTYKRRQISKKCFMVMQDVNHQLFTESVLEEVMLSMTQPDEQRAKKLLEQLGLADYIQAHPMALSGGQKQRVAIAAAVASDREFIILDEPTSGLDLFHMKQVADIIRQLQQLGRTVLVVTHDYELVIACCNYVVELNQGQVKDSFYLSQ